MLSSQSCSKLFEKLLTISYRQHRPSFKSSRKPLSLLDSTSRFYSSHYCNTNLRPVGSLPYISNHQRNFIICCGQFRTVNNLDLTFQRRNFSFKESFDSVVVTHSAIFKSISESFVVEKAQHFIIQFHDSTGLPWWLSIILTTFIVRLTLTLPLALYQNYIIVRVENIKEEINAFARQLLYDVKHDVNNKRLSERRAQGLFNMNVRKEWTRLIERDNCHPAKAAILAIVQIPLWVIFSTAFRNLTYKLPHNDTYADIKWLELSVGGAAWFPNLTVPDSFVIPIVLGLSNLAIIEVQTMLHKGQRSKIQRYATNFFRGFSVFMIPVAASVPSCLTLYWATSSIFGLCQNLAILSPRVRRFVGIPPTLSSRSQPYAHLAEQIRNKFRR